MFLGWIGALVYIVAEVIPDAGLLRGSFQAFPRRRRIHELERAILDNPSAGNYEELGLLYLDDGDLPGPAPATIRRSRREPIRSILSTGAASLRSSWEISPRPFLISSARLPPILITTFNAPRGCWLTPTRKPVKRKKPRRCFSRRQRFPPARRLTTTTLCSCTSQGRNEEARAVGAENSRQTTHHASLPAPPRASLVSQSVRAAGPAALAIGPQLNGSPAHCRFRAGSFPSSAKRWVAQTQTEVCTSPVPTLAKHPWMGHSRGIENQRMRPPRLTWEAS